MHRLVIALILLAAAAAAGGCDSAKSAAQVARDTSAAQQRSAESFAQAERTALDKESRAQRSLDKSERELAHQMALQAQKIADTQAEGRYKVAMARCGALGGETRRACAEAADADYEIAEAKAQLARTQADPSP